MQAYRPNSRAVRHRESGIALLTTAFGIASLVGAVGLGVDIGRMYIARNEAQLFADSAALDAALKLDGSPGGLERARQAVVANANRHGFSPDAFADPGIEFATAASGPFSPDPTSARGVRFVRVTAAAPVPVFFLRITGTPSSSVARAAAVAAQLEKTSFADGLFPFSPLAHQASPDFGFTLHNRYTLQWGASPQSGRNTCPGDDRPEILARAQAGGGAPRGYIDDPSDAILRQAVLADAQSRPLAAGDPLTFTAAPRPTLRQALLERIQMDADATAASFAGYKGNGRRIVVVPVNGGHPEFRIQGFAALFLLPAAEYPDTPEAPFCAEFIGPYVQGSRSRGAAAADAGAFVVRLVE